MTFNMYTIFFPLLIFYIKENCPQLRTITTKGEGTIGVPFAPKIDT